MSSQLPSSLPSTFQADGAPAHLLDWILGQKTKLLSGPPHSLKQERSEWVKTVVTIMPVLTLPSPAEIPWQAMHENTKLAEAALDLLYHTAKCVPSLYAGEEMLAEAVFSGLIILCATLDLWIDVDPPAEDEWPCPAKLYAATTSTVVAVLQALGEEVLPDAASRSRELMRSLLARCLVLGNDLMSASELGDFPVPVEICTTPDAIQILEDAMKATRVDITAASQLPLVMSNLMQICCAVVSAATAHYWFLADTVREVAQHAIRLYDHFFFTCLSPGPTTNRSLARICAAITTLGQTYGFEDVAVGCWTRLLLYRVEAEPDEDWVVAERDAAAAIRSSRLRPHNDADFHSLLSALKEEEWGDDGQSLRELCEAYLVLFVPTLDEQTLLELRDSFDFSAYAILRAAVGERLNSSLIDDVDHRSKQRLRRTLAREAVQDIIEPHVLDWMDDDDSLTDVAFISRSLAEVNNRFEQQPVWNTAPSALQALARKLGDLPCLLMHGEEECETSANKPDLNFVGVYFKVAFHILESDDPRKIHASVRAAVYDSLGKSLRHHSAAIDDRVYEDITGFITRGMRDEERLVRLAAGRAMVNLVKLMLRLNDRPAELVAVTFQKVNPLMKHAENRVRETTAITVGLVGKTSTEAPLRESICSLTTLVCEHNPILQGTAVLQLHALVKYHKKSPYNLTSPYLDRIAPFIVKRLKTHPHGVQEFCRFLSMSQRDFVELTLKHTLPRLFAESDLRGLEAVAAEAGSTLAMLVLENAHYILAYVFMLQGIGQTNKTLQFILNVLRAAASDGSSLHMSTLIASCAMMLLTEIVICMGDEDPDVAEAAAQGLHKVARLYPPSKSKHPSGSEGEYRAFLKEHMLGVISTLNDMLQEVHGRQSIESKQKILRSFGEFAKQVGPAISTVAPQMMATLQTMLVVPQLSDAALQSWYSFLAMLEHSDFGPLVGPTSASFVASWSQFSERGRQAAKQCLDYMIKNLGKELGPHIAEVADLSTIPELADTSRALARLRSTWTPQRTLIALLQRLEGDSLAVAIQSAVELKAFLLTADEEYIRSLTSGDVFDPLVGHIISALYHASCRDGEGTEKLHELAFECIGIVGAIDPDRFELRVKDNRMIMLSNFTNEDESTDFALHLIRDVLVGAFRSTSDMRYQGYLAYAIQELLQFCKFTPALVTRGGSGSVPIKVRSRWKSLPKPVLETVTPLLESRFSLDTPPLAPLPYPIYPNHATYRQWVQAWTSDLIEKVTVAQGKRIFQVFAAVVRNKDVGVAHHLLPHLVLTVLATGESDHAGAIRTEILAVLQDQVDPGSRSSPDKKLLSAQTVFMLLDHLNKWIRTARQHVASQQTDTRRQTTNSQMSSDAAEQLLRIDSVLENIDQSLMAKAAFQCKAYARSLMNLEQRLVACRGRDLRVKRDAEARDDKEAPQAFETPTESTKYQDEYERLHELYAHLDEPDGMEGVSTMILAPSLEGQIRQHESTGTWTSAQSCWEVRLQYEPDNLEYHLGLLRCLRNLGHYDTLRTHVMGVLTKHPDWSPHLVGYQVESESMVGHWDDVDALVKGTDARPPPVLLAQILLAMRAGDNEATRAAVSAARKALGASITASGPGGYRRSYDAVLDLHLVHELEIINNVAKNLGGPGNERHRREQSFQKLLKRLTARFDSTLPTFRTREQILNMRRTVFNLSDSQNGEVRDATGKSWLTSAKIARKAGHIQTAYSAVLQAQQCDTPFSFVESAKLVRARGDPLRALQELEKAMRLAGIFPSSRERSQDQNEATDSTISGDDRKQLAKIHVLRARYMDHTDRFEDSRVNREYRRGVEICKEWEGGFFHLGQFQDECFRALPTTDQKNRGMRMNFQTVIQFIHAMRTGSKYIYQAMPRVLTIWLDLAEDKKTSTHDIFIKINEEVARQVKHVAAFKWYTAFPQIVSRIGIKNRSAYDVLSSILSKVISEYPKQALWPFCAVYNSKDPNSERKLRAAAILKKLLGDDKNSVPQMITVMTHLTEIFMEVTTLEPGSKTRLRLSHVCGKLRESNPFPSPAIIPLEASLTASLPLASVPSSLDSGHYPFPVNVPTFACLRDEADIMNSLAKPKKIVIDGDDGQVYTFLAKKDDLRKDSRLLDFNVILNKLLKSDTESRRRQLHIRTYSVVSLNEAAGLIQWVPNTAPIRPILHQLYERQQVSIWNSALKAAYDRLKMIPDDIQATKTWERHILHKFPPVLHEWFIETFPEPSVWLASRTAYSRTAAVMSMVGYVVGLGDRHSENILLDTNCGDVVHVDFDCLFDKGQDLDQPEVVPFRLTHNIVDGFGVTGVEGVFRISCEVTLRLLRENKDCLSNVLDAFVHDPLVEWTNAGRSRGNRHGSPRSGPGSLTRVNERLQGIFKSPGAETGRQLSVSNHVQSLILQATDHRNLARMYSGWAPHQ